MDLMLAELERGFREAWTGYRPGAYENYLNQVEVELRTDLLIRLLCAEVEFNYQPPPVLRPDTSAIVLPDDDDQRVRPTVRLFLLQFPQLRKRVDGIIQLSVLEYALRIRFDPIPPDIASYMELCEEEQERLGGLLQLTKSKVWERVPHESQAPAVVRSGDSTEPEITAAKPVVLDQLPCNLGCFLLIRELGKGGMGNVYSAIDLRSTAHVAVKLMRHLDSWSIYRFVEEFSWLSQLNHPHLVQLYDAFSEGDTRYFSMEQVEGLTIRNWFQTLDVTDPSRWNLLRQVLAETASAIRFLHECDVIHRDVKPSNLMITPGRRAMLLDLGLAMRAGKTPAGLQLVDGSKIVGTIQYLPPESLRGEPQTFASDWYSFGVLIFETITNSFPPIAIDPKNKDIKLRYQLNEVSLRTKLVGLPEDLICLCIDLLSGDARSRPLGNEIIERLGAAGTQSLSLVADNCCIGRDEVLQEITGCFRAAEKSGQFILLRGESGIGKTTLLKHWTRTLQQADEATLLFHFTCHLQDHTPLRALNLLAQQLVTLMPEMPRELWEDLTSNEGAEIVYGFPQTQQLMRAGMREKDPSIGVAELAARRAAGLHALLFWLRELSNRRSVVIVIDDAQWADADSGRLLSQLFAPTSGFQGMLLIADQGESVESPLVNSILSMLGGAEHQAVRRIDLQPLDKSVCRELLEKWSIATRVQLLPEISTDLTRRSGGNPFLLREVLSAYVNHVVQFKLDDEAWLKTARQQARGGHLRSRFSLLPISMERVLQYLAIADEALGFHQLQTVSRVLPHELLPLINYLASQGWIRINGTSLDSEVEIAHSRFRDVVLDSMPDDRIYRRHYRIARTLSSESPPPWSRIAHHYWEAHRFREAAACYMEAARSSARSNAYIEAVWYLERAFHPIADRSIVEHRNALRLKADCLAASGRSSEAIGAYEQLSVSSEDKAELHLLNCLMGEQWIAKGKLSQGIQCLRSALEDFGVTAETNTSWLSSMMLWMEARQLSAVHHGPKSPPRSYEPFTATEQCLNRIGTALVFLDIRLGSKLIMALVNAAAHRGSDSDRAIALLRWGALIALGNQRTRTNSAKWIRAGRRLAKRSQNATAIALAETCTFIWLFAYGRFERAMPHGKKSLSLYRSAELTHQWEYGFVQWTLLILHWYAGELCLLLKTTSDLRLQWTAHPDVMWGFWTHTHAAHLIDLIGDNPAEGRAALRSVDKDVLGQPFESPRFFLWISDLRQELYEGNLEIVGKIFKLHWNEFAESQLSKIVHYRWLANSLRLCFCLSALDALPDRKDKWLKEANATSRRLSSMSEPLFAMVAACQDLVVKAAHHRVAPRARWSEVISQLCNSDMRLFAFATAWHAALYLPDEPWHAELVIDKSIVPAGDVRHREQIQSLRGDASSSLMSVEDYLRSQGCAAPAKLMRIILPLPDHY